VILSGNVLFLKKNDTVMNNTTGTTNSTLDADNIEHDRYGFVLKTNRDATIFTIDFRDNEYAHSGGDGRRSHRACAEMHVSDLTSINGEYCCNSYLFRETTSTVNDLRTIFEDFPDVARIVLRGDHFAGARATVTGLRLYFDDKRPDKCVISIETVNAPRSACHRLAADTTKESQSLGKLDHLQFTRIVDIHDNGEHHKLATFPPVERKYGCLSVATLRYSDGRTTEHNILAAVSTDRRSVAHNASV
jgi:hypothetical protein